MSGDRKEELERHVFSVLDARERFSEQTLADLYVRDKMPEVLRNAHHDMDLAVERCYRKKPFTSDQERLKYLFELYEKLVKSEEQVVSKSQRKSRKGK